MISAGRLADDLSYRHSARLKHIQTAISYKNGEVPAFLNYISRYKRLQRVLIRTQSTPMALHGSRSCMGRRHCEESMSILQSLTGIEGVQVKRYRAESHRKR